MRTTLNRMQKLLGNVKVVSFDIFDTVLFRTCGKSTDVYYQVGLRAIANDWLPSGWSAKSFQEVRMLAEKSARRNKQRAYGSDEITLEEIYACMPQGRHTVWGQFAALELAVEQDLCYLNPDVMAFITELHHQQVPIVLISDMYLSSDHIRSILKSLGFPLAWIDHMIVSNEYGVGKSSGALFARVVELYPHVEPQHILHIGDNRTADVEGAKLAGIQSYQYNVIPEQEETVFAYEDIRYATVLPEIRSLRKLAVDGCDGREFADYAKLGAGVLGPVLTAFSEWVVDQCQHEHEREVFLFMREGPLLRALIEECAKRRGVDIGLHLVYVSRHATDLAGLDCVDEAAVQMFFGWRDVTVKSLLAYLELLQDGIVFQRYYDCLLADCEAVCWDQQMSVKYALTQWLLAPAQQQKLNQLLNDKRSLLVRYLQQVMGDELRGITVDLGFKGTIQQSLENAICRVGKSSHLIHLMAIGAKENAVHLLNNTDIRAFSGFCGEDRDIVSIIMNSPDILEMQVLAAEGSTMGYTCQPSNEITPYFMDYTCPLSQTAVVKAIQEGVRLFQGLWLYLTDVKPHLREIVQKRSGEFLRLIARQIDFPTTQEAHLLGELYYENNRWTLWNGKVCSAADEQKLINIGPDAFWRSIRLGYQSNGVLWPQGVLTRKNPYFLMERYVLASNRFSQWLMLKHLVDEVLHQGHSKVIIYGAGDVGRTLVKIAQGQGLTIEYVVDQKQALWGQRIAEVEIASLERALTTDCTVFLIGSFAFIGEITSSIQNKCREINIKPTIFNVN